MKNLLFILVMCFSTTAFSAEGPGDIFESGSDEFEFEKYSNENVLAMIEADMEFACTRNGLCTLHSVSQSDSRFTATFQFGEGSPSSNVGAAGGTTIITDGSNASLYEPQPYYGVKLEYTRGHCTQTINVPRSLYISMNRYMYDLMDENGNSRRGFDPSKEAMIMFYTSIMKQASGCTAGR